MKKIGAIFTAIISISTAFSKTIEVPVARYLPTMDQSETVQIEWDEKTFGAQPSTIYNHQIARIACLLSENSYVDVNKDTENNELTRTYRLLGVDGRTIEYHYNLDYETPGLKNNQAAFSFAFREIDSALGKKTLVFVVIRGTPMNAEEWTSNLSISDSSKEGTEVHEGFYRAMQNVHSSLIYYLLKHKIDPDDTFFLITGHSRGAAVSNLLGATLCDQNVFKPQNLYVYTFATPNVSTEEKTKLDRYGFIWNIVNASDVVPTVPPNRGNWTYKKYGHTLALVNSWNVDLDTYQNNYYPRMNAYYKKFTKRDYEPFKTGPFLQIQITRLLTSFYGSVEKYYGFFGIREKAEKILKKTFKKPVAEELAQTVEEGPKKGSFLSFANSLTNNALENVTTTCLEMHLCENYLAWMLALEEDEAFSYMGSSQLVINGTFDGAVFDKDNNMLLRIYDGMAQIQTIKEPIGVMPIMKTTVIGFPGNQDFVVVIYKDSLIPTKVPVTVEHYDAAGVLESISPVKKVYPHLGTSVVMIAGSTTVSDKITSRKSRGKEAKKYIEAAKLKQQYKMSLTADININTDGNFGGGILYGSRLFYISANAEKYATDITKAFDVGMGIGHSQSLYGSTLIDTELGAKIVFTELKNDDVDSYLIPTAQFLISFKPIHKTRFYVGGMFDLKIDGFNGPAFDEDLRPRNIGTININDTCAIIPSIKFGVRF